MRGVSKCENCGKEFSWRRPNSQGPAKLCSNLCNPKYLKSEDIFKYIIKQYEERVIKNEVGCWDWNGIKDTKQGYARIHVQDRNYSAHRVSWQIVNGEIPPDKQINHHCDNRQCTRPDHLYLGTQKQNDEDRIKRNRQAKGSRNAAAILNEDKVIEIKQLLYQGLSCKKISMIYNVCPATIAHIKSGKNWRHVK